MSTGSAPDRGRITREQILAAAMALLDQRGLPDLTMRKLAAELGIRPSALYWHFPDKQTLLARLADRIIGSAPKPPASSPGTGEGLRRQTNPPCSPGGRDRGEHATASRERPGRG